MRTLKSYLLAGSGLVVLLGSFVFSAPRATHGRDSKSIGPVEVSAVQESARRLPVSGRVVARARLGTPSFSQAASSDKSDDLSIDASLGDEQIALKRKHRRPGHCCTVVISIIAVLVGKPSDDGPPMIDLQATITGADARQGSLLYALAWLAGDTDPLNSVRKLGYDLGVKKEQERSCTGELTKQMCVERARQLATLLDATLALGDAQERARFRQDASAIGVAPDCSQREP